MSEVNPGVQESRSFISKAGAAVAAGALAIAGGFATIGASAGPDGAPAPAAPTSLTEPNPNMMDTNTFLGCASAADVLEGTVSFSEVAHNVHVTVNGVEGLPDTNRDGISFSYQADYLTQADTAVIDVTADGYANVHEDYIQADCVPKSDSTTTTAGPTTTEAPTTTAGPTTTEAPTTTAGPTTTEAPTVAPATNPAVNPATTTTGNQAPVATAVNGNPAYTG